MKMKTLRWMVMGLCCFPAFGAIPLACGGTPQEPGGTAGQGAQGGEAHGGATGGATPGGAAGTDAGGGAGGAEGFCDCGDDPHSVHVPLACACRAGLCSTLDFDPKRRDIYEDLDWPYIVLYGTCADGYHTVKQSYACENGSVSTYDGDDKLAYSSSAASAPAACGSNAGNADRVIIGEADPARDCSFCVVAAHGDGQGSTCVEDELEAYPPCDPDWAGWSEGGAGGAGGAGAGGAGAGAGQGGAGGAR